jgi:tetratricopeptide (TPR) repeat protein
LQKAGKHEEAMQAINRNKELIPSDKDRIDLLRSVTDRWAGSLRDKGEYSRALDVYDSALKSMSDDRHLTTNRTWTMRAWVKQSAKTSEDAARKTLQTLRTRYPAEKALDSIARDHVQDIVSGLNGKGKFTDALKVIDQNRVLLGGTEKARQEGALNLSRRVYDRWAKSLADGKKWKEAVKVYADALKKFPKDNHLSNNAVAIQDRWGKTFIKVKDWDGAIGVYKEGLKQFPDNFVLKNNLRYCEEKKKEGLSRRFRDHPSTKPWPSRSLARSLTRATAPPTWRTPAATSRCRPSGTPPGACAS